MMWRKNQEIYFSGRNIVKKVMSIIKPCCYLLLLSSHCRQAWQWALRPQQFSGHLLRVCWVCGRVLWRTSWSASCTSDISSPNSPQYTHTANDPQSPWSECCSGRGHTLWTWDTPAKHAIRGDWRSNSPCQSFHNIYMTFWYSWPVLPFLTSKIT